MSSTIRLRSQTHLRISIWAVLCLLLGATVVQAQPTVNGLFYGDGDDAFYSPYAASDNGSVLYAYVDAPTTTLYVALVVGHAVNDLVCSPQNNRAYTQSADWGNHRSCKRASDSEFATFSLECAPNSPNAWMWQQALGCATNLTDPESDWVSNSTCGPSSPAADWPPGVEANATSSWVANVNTYQDATTARGWNMYQAGTDVGVWKSPFVAGSPNDVTQVPGYPTYSGSNYQWEWSMVYEWSVDLGAGGANCGGEAIYFLAGNSHHSPGKNGQENDPFNPITDTIMSDWGDLPDGYGTTAAAGGARHYYKVTGPYLGAALQPEIDGQPSTDATGDGSEEDGVVAVVDENWTAGSTRSFEVTVGNAPSGAVLAGWFDWNGDGDFDDADEYVTWTVSEGTNTLDVVVGSAFDWQNDTLNSRFRLFSSGATAPGGSLTQADSVGTATDGEVEDYTFQAASLPVTLNAWSSERLAGGDVVARWQTASETDNVGFEVWGLIRGEWQPLTELVASTAPSSALPQTYEVTFAAPPELSAVELVDYDVRGRAGRYGAFRVGTAYGAPQPVRTIDWTGPRTRRIERLEERGFSTVASPTTRRMRVAGDDASRVASGPWKKLDTARRGRNAAPTGSAHVAVTEAGIQRVTYEALRDAGLDLAGVQAQQVAVTFRGEPVDRAVFPWGKIGPGSVLEFVGAPPSGDDALYLNASLYQVSVEPAKARGPRVLGQARVRDAAPSYLREERIDRPRLYRQQSPTGDPWVDHSVLVRGSAATTLTLDLPITGPVADGPGRLEIDLGLLTDLPDQRGADGSVLPETEVEVWFGPAGGALQPLTTAALGGREARTVTAVLPSGALSTGAHEIELRLSTPYFYSLVVVDDYAVSYPSPYLGPSLDFAPTVPATGTGGYRIDGFTTAAVSAYAVHGDGTTTALAPRIETDGAGFTAELRAVDAERIWVTETPHAPAVFTTAPAAGDLLAGPADLVVLAAPSFIGTPALDAYLAQRADLDPVVVDVEDVYNAYGYGMALPSALTDYLRARDGVFPFSHVQLVGADCYDRLNHVSDCVSFLPLPTAPVGASAFTPSQNRLVDLDGDGVADKAVGQFSVRDEQELATVIAKASAWEASGLAARESALLIAEETDGLHDFAAQVERLGDHLGWTETEVLDLTDHPQIGTAQTALRSSLDAGRAVTLYSGHSSPTVWAFRGLLTAADAGTLPNTGRPTLMLPLACETTWDVSPNAEVLGHQLLFGNDGGAVAVSGAAALSRLEDNEQVARSVLRSLDDGRTLGEAVLDARRSLGPDHQELQDNWLTQGDVALRLER